jgi:superfamily I DNA and/or RNA helicase
MALQVVILSTVRSRGVKPSLSAFMKDERRCCVALSRARRLCLVVGNSNEMATKGGDLWRRIVGAYKAVP